MERGDDVIFEKESVKIKVDVDSKIAKDTKDTKDTKDIFSNPIEAKIIASIPEQGLVMLNAGKDKEIKVGYIFTVSRKKVTIGQVQVIEIHPNVSAGRILNDPKVKQVTKLERGDDVILLPSSELLNDKILTPTSRQKSNDSTNATPTDNKKNADSPKVIHAKIISELYEQDLVMIDVGKADEVKVGYKFTVYRASDYIGKVEVIEVYPAMSACKIIKELNNLQGLKIEKGDSAIAN